MSKYIIILSILFMSCGNDNTRKQMEYKKRGKLIEGTMYTTKSGAVIEVIDSLEGHKIILWHRGYGSDMEIIKIK